MKFGLLLVLLLLVFYVSALEFNESSVDTWAENPDDLKDVNMDKKQSVWDDATGEERDSVISDIAKDLREGAISDYKSGGLVSKVLGGIGGLFGAKKEEPVKDESNQPSNNLELVGFSSEKLKWDEGLVMTDGNIRIDLEDVPPRANKIIYDEENSRVFYETEDGGKIVISRGGVNKDNVLTLDVAGEEREFGLDVSSDGAEIDVLSDGQFKFKGGASISLENRTFKNEEGESVFSIVGSSHFKGNNLEVETPSVKLNVADNDEETNIFFREGDASDPYGQRIYISDAVYMKKEDGFRALSVVAIGEGLSLEILEEDRAIDFIAKGKDIEVIVNGATIKFDGSKTLVPGTQEDYDKLNAYDGNLHVVNLNGGYFSTYKADEKNLENGLAFFGKESKNSFVEIGGHQVFAQDVSILKQAAGHLTAESLINPVTKEGLLNPKISEARFFVSQDQRDEFMDLHPNGLNDYNADEFMSICTTLNCRTVVERDLTEKQMSGKIGDEIKSLGLSAELEKEAAKFKTEVFTSMGGKGAPANTEIYIGNRVDGEGKIEGGIFKITLPGKKSKELYLPGNFIHKRVGEGIELIPFNAEKIRDKSVELPKQIRQEI